MYIVATMNYIMFNDVFHTDVSKPGIRTLCNRFGIDQALYDYNNNIHN